MRPHRILSRRATNSGLTTTAGAIVALMAMAASISTVPTARAAIVETRTSLAEAKAVRAVAAAMVAVARELAGKDRVDSTLPIHFTVPSGVAPRIATIISLNDRSPRILERLSERLLDLPPPGC